MSLRRQTLVNLFSARFTLAGAVAIGSLGAPAILAAPQGGVVASGSAAISSVGNVTTIRQSTAAVAIDWQSFDIAPREIVQFRQPDGSAIALNRVLGNERTLIEGVLNANGRVFLINSNGVLFSRSSSVNAAGLVVSSLDLSDADFNAGRYSFRGAGHGDVVNQGDLRAGDGGYVVLLGGTVSNQGTLSAELGTVVLASGNRVTLDLADGSGVNVTMDEGRLNALVENRQAILADGGQVILTARAAGDLLSAQVNNTGIIQARTLDDLTGSITLRSEGGRTLVGGTLDASAPGAGDGGSIDTSGERVQVLDGSRITTVSKSGRTGHWLIDPDGFTVGTGGDISGSELSAQLANNNVTVASTSGSGSDGDIHVRDAISWSAGTQLELDATHDIEVGAPVSATGSAAHLVLSAGHDINIDAPVVLTGSDAGLVMNTGGYATNGTADPEADYHINNLSIGADGAVQVSDAAITLSGAHAALTINGSPYTLIHSMAELAALSAPVLDANGDPVVSADTGRMDFTPAIGDFALAQDLDAVGNIYAYPVINTLVGNLAGLGHSISRLTVAVKTANQYAQFEDAALIGTLGSFDDPSGRVRDVRLVDAFIASGDDATLSGVAAGLVATNLGTVDNVYVNAYLRGTQPVGGIVAFNYPGATVSHAYADITIDAHAAGTGIGGVVGENFGTVDASSARGSINASGIDLHDGGGLTASTGIGGLVGQNLGGTVSASSADVDITATNSLQVGGLVGLNFWGSTIIDSSASGDVNVTWANSLVNGLSYGGLVGDNNGGAIIHSSASGNLTVGTAGGEGQFVTDIGGLVGTNEADLFGFGGTIDNSTASGNVSVNGSGFSIGGAVGNNFFGAISGVSASGNVSGGPATDGLGGLVGSNTGAISQSSASGDVSGGSHVGGLAGYNTAFGSIDGSHASGQVVGGSAGGDLVGSNDGGVSDSAYQDGGALVRQQLLRAQVQAAITQATTEEAVAMNLDGAPHLDAAQPAALDAQLQLLTTDYSADVKSLSVDGVQFDLEESSEPRKPASPEPGEPR